MKQQAMIVVDGLVSRTVHLSADDLAAIEAAYQVPDVSKLDAARRGTAVRLAAVLDLAGAVPTADYLTVHSGADDFHASVPLPAVRERAVLIYRLDGESLPASAGGPFRLLIPDFAACHTAEIDECANVKFVDRIELSSGRGFDNRPVTAADHADLHRKEQRDVH